jgi:hypothetical protein
MYPSHHKWVRSSLDIAQRLLIDLQAQDSGWLLTWLTPHVTAMERQLLADLVGRTALN